MKPVLQKYSSKAGGNPRDDRLTRLDPRQVRDAKPVMRDTPRGSQGRRCLLLPIGAAALLVAACIGGEAGRANDLSQRDSIGQEVPEAFPAHPGRAAFLLACGRCHTPRFVLGTKRSREQWAQVIDRMVERGAKVSRHDRGPIAAYLLVLQDRRR
ncbi:MAG: hypothetical protein WDN24_01565 [Sphingomonas sp.]